jgi:hypothetical protein
LTSIIKRRRSLAFIDYSAAGDSQKKKVQMRFRHASTSRTGTHPFLHDEIFPIDPHGQSERLANQQAQFYELALFGSSFGWLRSSRVRRLMENEVPDAAASFASFKRK